MHVELHKKWIISNLNQAKQVFNFFHLFVFFFMFWKWWAVSMILHICLKATHKSHVPSVAKVETALIGALVGSSLQSNNCVACSQLLLGEVSFISISLLRSDGALTIFGSLSLNNHINLRQALIKKSSCAGCRHFFFIIILFSAVYLPCDRVLEGRWQQRSGSAFPTNQQFETALGMGRQMI